MAETGITSLLNQLGSIRTGLEDKGFSNPVDLTKLAAREAALKNYLGQTDYSKQLAESQNMGKLRFALDLARRGFESAGATPKRGENPFATVSRELLAPVAGSAGEVATEMMKQRRAVENAKRQEERQIKLAALSQAQDKSKSLDAAALSLFKDSLTPKTSNLTTSKVEGVEATVALGGKDINLPNTNVVVQINKANPTKQNIVTVGKTTLVDGTVVPAGTQVTNYRKTTPPAQPMIKRGIFGQVYDPVTDTYKQIGNVTRVQRYLPNPSGEGVVPEDKYYVQQLGGKIVELGDFFENIDTHSPPKKSEPLYVIDAAATAKALGLPKGSVVPNELITTFIRSGLTDRGGLPDMIQRRYKGNQVELTEEFIKSGAVRTTPLTEAEEEAQGLKVPSFKKVEELTITGATVELLPGAKVGERIIVEKNNSGDVRYLYKGKLISEDKGNQFLARDLGSLEEIEADIEPEVRADSYTFITGDKIGQSTNLTPTAFSKLSIKEKQKLSSDPKEIEKVRKKLEFVKVWQTTQDQNQGVLRSNLAKERKPTDSELESLLGMFPTGRRGEGLLEKAILKMLQNPDKVDLVSSNAANVSEKYLTFGQQVRVQLDKAGEKYTALRERGVLPDKSWDQLSYIEKQAFASLPARGMSEDNVNKNWLAAKEKISNSAKNFTFPDKGDSTAVAAAVKLQILVDYLINAADMDKSTGILVGPWAELGAKVFGDYEPVTSSSSQRVNQIITNMKSALKTLSSTEGDDGRPSNYRIALAEELLPKFTQPEALNRRNLKTISSKLKSNLKSLFVPESARKNVVPQSWVKAAAEAGIKVQVNPKLYSSFMDPNDPINKDFDLVTREQVMQSIDKFAFTKKEFDGLRVGQPLPPDQNGLIFIKISPTEIQLARKGSLRPDPKKGKYVFK